MSETAITHDVDRARERRLRRLAQRDGFVLRKLRRRDTRIFDYGRYFLIDASTNGMVSSEFGWDLDDVEEYLSQES